VNQTTFNNLPKASSMAVIMQKEFDLETLLDRMLFYIKKNCSLIASHQEIKLWNDFHNHLFKLNVPMPFEDANQNRFMGIIQGVTEEGKLEVALENDVVKTYGIKEIQMLF
jgi:BirA family biotin operon repressor/biotin-[acetyl-CoA-carboxylase] ligase